MEANVLTKPLVAVSGQDAALYPVHYALDLAVVSDEPVEVLIVQEVAASPELAWARGQALGHGAARMVRAAWEASKQTEHQIHKLANDRFLQARFTHRIGRIGDWVERAAEQASCIIVARSASGVGGPLRTDVESVVRRTHKPVLLVPPRYRPLRRILVGYAGKELGETALKTASGLAVALDLPLEVVTVASHRYECYPIQEQAEHVLKHSPTDVSFTGVPGNPADALVERTGADRILVMGASGHSCLYRLILGSVTERVIRNASGPVLVSAKPLPAGSAASRPD
jgi:nucleotide-binding universal stress UspA family protein